MNGRRGSIFASTDLPLAAFLLSAGLGVWPAFDRSLAWPPLLAVAGGVALYFLVSRLQAGTKSWHLCAGAAVLGGVLLAVYFISQYSHLGYATKFETVSRLGEELGATAPRVARWAPHRNSVATCLEGVIFLAVALAWESRRHLSRLVWGLAAGLLVVALALTASRGAWFAIGMAGFVWAGLRQRSVRSSAAATVVLTVLPLIIGLGACLAIATGIMPVGTGFAGTVLDRPDRLDLYRGSVSLLRDYAWTGIGLGGQFAMALSRYVLLIQVPYLTYSHNLYLEVWLEQGMAGVTAWIWLLAALFLSFRIFPRFANATMAQAAGLGLLATLLHGIVDARQYVDLWCWVPFFVLLGLHATALRQDGFASSRASSRVIPVAVPGVFLIVVLLTLRPVTATWQANLGAVSQAKAELGSSNTNTEQKRIQLEEAGTHFRRALAIDGRNVTANFRLGLMQMDADRFQEAVGFERAAWEADQCHTATRKAFGLASVWVGDLVTALPLLRPLPGIVAELNTWGWWRASQKQPELAIRAYRMSLELEPDQPAVRDALTALERSSAGSGLYDRR